MAELEAAIAARQNAEEEARLKREQEKETAIRSQQKDKVISPSSHPITLHLFDYSTFAYECGEHSFLLKFQCVKREKYTN